MSETLAGYIGWAIFIFMAAFWLVIEIAYRRWRDALKSQIPAHDTVDNS